jgi:hypothetical protein
LQGQFERRPGNAILKGPVQPAMAVTVAEPFEFTLDSDPPLQTAGERQFFSDIGCYSVSIQAQLLRE